MSGQPQEVLNIAWLFPGTFHLYGESGNILALRHQGARLSWDVRVTRVELGEVPGFRPEAYDMIVSPPTQIPALATAAPALAGIRDRLGAWIDDGGVLLSTGSNMALWGHGIDCLDGSWLPGLGLVDYSAQELESVVGDDLFVRYTGHDGTPRSVISHQTARMNIFPGPEATSFGDVVYGYGQRGVGYRYQTPTSPQIYDTRDRQTGYHRSAADTPAPAPLPDGLPAHEGIVRRHSLFTQLLGPVLFVDRRLLVELLTPIAERRGIRMTVDRLDWAEYDAAHGARKAYIERKVSGALYRG